MTRFLQRQNVAVFAAVIFSLIAQTGCLFHRHRQTDVDLGPGSQPDKILYQRALDEFDKGRYDVGRLTLQTMLNAYPDSEFLAKAKLAIADSYYTQGGVSGLTQAEAEYKDFITFFPTAPEAPEAQFRAGMSHYRLMGKSDRDLTQTRLAEAEFKEFLLKYPDNPVMPRVKGRLREVQEVLAEGEYDVAKFYYDKKANRAAKSRFQEIADDYPNFSGADKALWFLGQTLERLKTPNEAIPYYSRILTDYPLSPTAADAKERLTAMHQPIPSATKATLARAEADEFNRKQNQQGLFGKFGGMFASKPNLASTRHGPVLLGPRRPSETAAKSAGTGGAPGNVISVQPVGEESLKSGKAVSVKPASNGENKDTESANAKESESKTDKSTSETPQPPKKKGKFHLLKKIVKPF